MPTLSLDGRASPLSTPPLSSTLSGSLLRQRRFWPWPARTDACTCTAWDRRAAARGSAARAAACPLYPPAPTPSLCVLLLTGIPSRRAQLWPPPGRMAASTSCSSQQRHAPREQCSSLRVSAALCQCAARRASCSGWLNGCAPPQAQLSCEAGWLAHDLEAWVVRYDAWRPHVLYTGGDDSAFCWCAACKRCNCRQWLQRPARACRTLPIAHARAACLYPPADGDRRWAWQLGHTQPNSLLPTHQGAQGRRLFCGVQPAPAVHGGNR